MAVAKVDDQLVLLKSDARVEHDCNRCIALHAWVEH